MTDNSDNLEKLFRKKIKPVNFDRNMGLFGATTIGVGALMGAGVYVLIGLAANSAGPSVWLSYLICGGLAFLTTLLFAELARLVPKAGGGYVYAYDALGSLGGFTTGWFLALGSIFACALYSIGFAEYFLSLMGIPPNPYYSKMLAIVLIVICTFLNARPSQGSDKMQTILTWGNMTILTLLIVFSLFKINSGHLTPMFPKGLEGTGGAIGIIYISFFGYQLIANNADEIKDPSKTVPKAMLLSMGISFFFYLTIAVIAILVVPWEQLATSNAPLVEVANISFGAYGWLVISLGGVLAAAGALNSTLLSQSRQIYAMGKHRFFPNKMGELKESSKKPQAALLAGGALVALAVLFLNLEFIAQSANFCLLASLLPVSLALWKIYQNKKETHPTEHISFIKKLIPWAAFVANVGLLLTLDWVALAFGQQLALVGLLIYFFYSRKREQRAQEGMNIALTDKKQSSLLNWGNRILVPMANPQTQEAIFCIANALLSNKKRGETIALSVVDTPKESDFYEVLSDANESLEMMKRSSQIAQLKNVHLKPVIRASRDVVKGILNAAKEERCDMVVMGYANQKITTNLSLIDRIMQNAVSDLIFLKLKNPEATFQPKKIAALVYGKDNLDLIVDLAGSLSDQYQGHLTFISVLPQNYSRKQKALADETIIEALEKKQAQTLYSVKLLSAADSLPILIEESKKYDLMVLGTTKVGIFEKAAIGSFAVQFAEEAHCSVAMVRVATSVQKIMGTVRN